MAQLQGSQKESFPYVLFCSPMFSSGPDVMAEWLSSSRLKNCALWDTGGMSMAGPFHFLDWWKLAFWEHCT